MHNNKYHLSTMILHWVMGIAFLLMLGSGLAFDNIEMSQSLKFNMYQWHKSLGVLLLVAVTLRIVLRLIFKAPQLPENFKKLDIIAAKLGHLGLYILMIIMPVTGWMMVSSSPYGLPTIVFGLFEWPHIEWFIGDKEINQIAGGLHEIFGWVFIAMICLHVGAIIKHIVFEKINLLPRMLPMFLVMMLVATPSMAKPYNVDYDQSTITFSGTHAGNEFTGEFLDWNADINFNDNDLDNSSVNVTFKTVGAKTGNAMYDGTLPTTDWFDADNYPTATFKSTSFKKIETGFEIAGDLTIKGKTHPVTFNFMLSGDSPTTMTTEFSIDRFQFNIGKNSDANAEWVGKDIFIKVLLRADEQELS